MMYNSDITALKARCKAIEQENSQLRKKLRDLELYMEDVVDSALTVSKIARENTQIIQYIAQRDGVSESEVSFS
tara:strand:+ start:1326 stop:1547 length:222 start_codon:yes stop_codon:yes gene_type:complete